MVFSRVRRFSGSLGRWLLVAGLLGGCSRSDADEDLDSDSDTDYETDNTECTDSCTGPTDSGDTGGGCGEETSTVITDLDTVPTGFDQSVTELIAGVSGDYAGTFTWGPPDPIVMISHADTSSDLTVGLAHEGGEIRLIEVENAGDFPDSDGGVPCSNTLEVDMALAFDTADGVFAERWTVPLRIGSGPDDAIFDLYQTLDLNNMQGTLSEADFMPNEDATLRGVILAGDFADGMGGGSLIVEVELLGGVGAGFLAEWDATRP